VTLAIFAENPVAALLRIVYLEWYHSWSKV